jgi:hypothetical protein
MLVERELTPVGRNFYKMVVPRLVASGTSGFDSSSIFFTDGSKGGAGTGFGVKGTKWSVYFGDVDDFCGFDSNKDSPYW